MQRNTTLCKALRILLTPFFVLPTVCVAQNPPSNANADIPSLLNRLKSESEEVAGKAASELKQIGPRAVSAVIDFMHAETDCSARAYAADVLTEIEPTNQA